MKDEYSRNICNQEIQLVVWLLVIAACAALHAVLGWWPILVFGLVVVAVFFYDLFKLRRFKRSGP